MNCTRWPKAVKVIGDHSKPKSVMAIVAPVSELGDLEDGLN